MRRVEEFRVVVPARDLGEGVGADYEEELRREVAALVEQFEGPRSERQRIVAQLEIRGASKLRRPGVIDE